MQRAQEKTMKLVLERELETFAAHREELLGRAKGRFVLIKKDRILGEFVSREDAVRHGYAEFGNEPFLVKQVLEVEIPYTFTSVQLPA